MGTESFGCQAYLQWSGVAMSPDSLILKYCKPNGPPWQCHPHGVFLGRKSSGKDILGLWGCKILMFELTAEGICRELVRSGAVPVQNGGRQTDCLPWEPPESAWSSHCNLMNQAWIVESISLVYLIHWAPSKQTSNTMSQEWPGSDLQTGKSTKVPETLSKRPLRRWPAGNS